MLNTNTRGITLGAILIPHMREYDKMDKLLIYLMLELTTPFKKILNFKHEDFVIVGNTVKVGNPGIRVAGVDLSHDASDSYIEYYDMSSSCYDSCVFPSLNNEKVKWLTNELDKINVLMEMVNRC